MKFFLTTTSINSDTKLVNVNNKNLNPLLNHRLKAAKLFQNAIETKQIKPSQLGLEELFLADLYRRAGDFQSAILVLKTTETQPIETSIFTLIEYEKTLIEAKDTGYYQIDKAL